MKVYGLFGKSLNHSFSKSYFTEKFKTEKISAVYENFESPDVAGLSTVINNTPNLRGLNVTIPFKTDILSHLTQVDDIALQIGAVNTLSLEEESIVGYNTDYIGFSKSIAPFLTSGMEKALILGTGGASRAVAYALTKMGIGVFYASRYPKGAHQFHYSALNQNAMNQFLLIVNTTPLGTIPNVSSKPQLPYNYITSKHLLFDLVYNPIKTAFMRAGEQQGATVVNGLNMLKIQAEASWDIWNGEN